MAASNQKPSYTEEDLTFIVDQIIFLAIYNDKKIVVRPNVVKEKKMILRNIGTFLDNDDDFLVKEPLRAIREDYLAKKLTRQDALIVCLISLLLREETYLPKEDPKAFLANLKEETKEVIKVFLRGQLEELPIKLYQDLGIDVYSYTMSGKWTIKEKKVGNKEDNIRSILDRYQLAVDDPEVWCKIAEELRKESDTFIGELLTIESDEILNERLDNWSDHNNELKDLFDKVAQEKVDVEDFDKIDFKEFRTRYKEKEIKDSKYVKIRDSFAKILHRFFLDYGNPNNYQGQGEMSQEYIRKTLLPFILYFYDKKERRVSETYAYGGYLVSLLREQHNIKDETKYPSYLKGYIKQYLSIKN